MHVDADPLHDLHNIMYRDNILSQNIDMIITTIIIVIGT